MVGHQGEGLTGGSGLQQDGTQSVEKIIPILAVPEALAPFDSPANDVMQGSWCVYVLCTPIAIEKRVPQRGVE
jgi:hypothetical protein